MSERLRRTLIVICVAAIAIIMAFPLRDAIYRTIVVPAAFLAWNLNLWYRSLSQGIWWWVVIFIVLLMLSYSLMPQVSLRRRSEVRPSPALGQVEGLAGSLRRAERGIYFKWLIANRLGKLAYQILLHREGGRPRTFFTPLVSTDWEPPEELQTYLETGLRGSFADFPQNSSPLSPPRKTPLDFDISEAVDFLESRMENGSQKERGAGGV